MGKAKAPRKLADNEARAVLRTIRISPQKLNLVAALIRGKAVDTALADLEFSRKRIAATVKKTLESAIANYGIASVADLYDLAGITCRNYTANRYGWTDIQSAKVIRTREGYTLQLPRTVQIN